MRNPAAADGVADHPFESFAQFFDWWLAEHDRNLQSLHAAAADLRSPDQIHPLIAHVLSHYEHYYRTKSGFARRDVVPMFSPSWTSSTENLFLWIGGWRPSMAFHLLYSKSGLQTESQLPKLLNGFHTQDLADLTLIQMGRIDELQAKTIRSEKELSEEEARVQETVANSEMVELATALTEEGRGGEAMEAEMDGKRREMARVLERADRLRLDTLEGVVEILNPMQAVHFLIAAAELQLRVHEFGKQKDAAGGGGGRCGNGGRE